MDSNLNCFSYDNEFFNNKIFFIEFIFKNRFVQSMQIWLNIFKKIYQIKTVYSKFAYQNQTDCACMGYKWSVSFGAAINFFYITLNFFGKNFSDSFIDSTQTSYFELPVPLMNQHFLYSIP